MAKLSSSSSSDSSRELQCVGTLEIAKPKPVGFLCGSIPVPTDKSFHAFDSALLPTRQTVSAPRYRYRMLPTETDLNRPPLLSKFPEKVLPVGAVLPRTTGDSPWDGGTVASNLNRKCEALAVSGLVEYGDEIDVIAPADILKQIFKMPYSKARLSIAVHRIGQTLVLNTGPDVEEGEKFIRRHNNQSKCADQSLFLNFAMHSVRMEACDCPPTHHVPSQEKSNSSALPGGNTPQFVGNDDVVRGEGYNHCSEYTQVKQDSFLWESKKNKRNKNRDPIKKASQVGDKPRSSLQESEKQRKVGNDGFLRVLYWQFHNFRMLLGSDLLLFTNEKYVAVSLHLWDVTRQVTPLTWLEAWLDNVMASVPELAICYHHNGVVQGYELLKTDDIFLLKGVSDDGAPAFHPHVVQQNGLSVLRFLRDNCTQDPGAYWLYKSAGEDVIQLFDLSVIPKNHSSGDCDDSPSSLPSIMSRERRNSLYSLGTLLYRIAHRLSFSMAPNNRARCVRFFKKCLDFLDEPDHLAVRAIAHEQFARLILSNDEELNITFESLPLECEVTVTEAEEPSLDVENCNSDFFVLEEVSSLQADDISVDDGHKFLNSETKAIGKMNSEANVSALGNLIAVNDNELRDPGESAPSSSGDESFSICKASSTPTHLVQTVTDPISSKLAAVHHVSQAIKSIRWMRQLQSTEQDLVDQFRENHDRPASSFNVSVCACGDTDCIEVCDIREWLPTSKLDHKLWKLVLLLGESYLALAEAYKDDGQLNQALKVIQLACAVYGSMPPHLEDTKFISSMTSSLTSKTKFFDRNEATTSPDDGVKDVNSSFGNNYLTLEQRSSTYIFWAKAWTLVGDVYVEFHMIKGKEISIQEESKSTTRELKMSTEVVKEVKRLKKKLGQHNQNCSSCSLVNCSCQSDRASSGSSASSSTADISSVTYSRKISKRSYVKSSMQSPLRDPEDDCIHNKVENKKSSESESSQHKKYGATQSEASDANLAAVNCEKHDSSLEMHESGHETEIASEKASKVKNGGIFMYLDGSLIGDAECNLSASLRCYEEARNALHGVPSGLAELQSVVKKTGWVCNELGRLRLEKKEMDKAELAFTDAINAFREVSDHTNIILINCNLGHGRRALAEAMVSKIEDLKLHSIFHNVYRQALETAKLEYRESLRYYGAAKSELNDITEDTGSGGSSLRNEVYTQFAHTNLRIGMFLAREDITAEVYEPGSLKDKYSSPYDRKARKGLRKHEISANDAIREALSIYESLGEFRKQEAAYAYFQLACYQRDCCLKFIDSDYKKSNLAKGENSILQRVKQYASLADRNWQKAMDFYGPKTHPIMYLTILMEGSSLSLSLSGPLRSAVMLESALARMLEGRHVSDSNLGTFSTNYPEIHAKFWSQMQMLLKKILSMTLPSSVNKSSVDGGKIRELYKMSLKATEMSQLYYMHSLWTRN
ncbi:Erythroid differentiation-related factor 1 [Quillaja saponaria]|uniref:Erythroid differentiation-related factor 1 n=1 Tax=Quillaja saponaria TaxID=32244 RepID=A0AAD7VFQ4_QUISA|nr:Erythroid differentiation-related factor 1 [Quillaja saponaria]